MRVEGPRGEVKGFWWWVYIADGLRGVLTDTSFVPPRCTSTEDRDTVLGARFRVQGAGCRVQVSGFRVQGSGWRVEGSGFRVQPRSGTPTPAPATRSITPSS